VASFLDFGRFATGVHRTHTRGGPNEIESTAVNLQLNGSCQLARYRLAVSFKESDRGRALDYVESVLPKGVPQQGEEASHLEHGQATFACGRGAPVGLLFVAMEEHASWIKSPLFNRISGECSPAVCASWPSHPFYDSVVWCGVVWPSSHRQ